MTFWRSFERSSWQYSILFVLCLLSANLYAIYGVYTKQQLLEAGFQFNNDPAIYQLTHPQNGLLIDYRGNPALQIGGLAYFVEIQNNYVFLPIGNEHGYDLYSVMVTGSDFQLYHLTRMQEQPVEAVPQLQPITPPFPPPLTLLPYNMPQFVMAAPEIASTSPNAPPPHHNPIPSAPLPSYEQFIAMQNQIDQLKADTTQLKSRLNESRLSEKSDELNAENQRLHHSLKTITSNKDFLEAKIAEAEKQEQALHEKCNSLEDCVKKLKVEKRTLTNILEQHREQLSETIQKNNESQHTIQQITTQNKDLKNQLESAASHHKSEKESVIRNNHQLEERLKKLERKNRHLQELVAESEAKSKQQEAEKERTLRLIKYEKKEFEQILLDKDHQLAALQKEIREKNDKLTNLPHELEHDINTSDVGKRKIEVNDKHKIRSQKRKERRKKATEKKNEEDQLLEEALKLLTQERSTTTNESSSDIEKLNNISHEIDIFKKKSLTSKKVNFDVSLNEIINSILVIDNINDPTLENNYLATVEKLSSFLESRIHRTIQNCIDLETKKQSSKEEEIQKSLAGAISIYKAYYTFHNQLHQKHSALFKKPHHLNILPSIYDWKLDYIWYLDLIYYFTRIRVEIDPDFLEYLSEIMYSPTYTLKNIDDLLKLFKALSYALTKDEHTTYTLILKTIGKKIENFNSLLTELISEDTNQLSISQQEEALKHTLFIYYLLEKFIRSYFTDILDKNLQQSITVQNSTFINDITALSKSLQHCTKKIFSKAQKMAAHNNKNLDTELKKFINFLDERLKRSLEKLLQKSRRLTQTLKNSIKIGSNESLESAFSGQIFLAANTADISEIPTDPNQILPELGLIASELKYPGLFSVIFNLLKNNDKEPLFSTTTDFIKKILFSNEQNSKLKPYAKIAQNINKDEHYPDAAKSILTQGMSKGLSLVPGQEWGGRALLSMISKFLKTPILTIVIHYFGLSEDSPVAYLFLEEGREVEFTIDQLDYYLNSPDSSNTLLIGFRKDHIIKKSRWFPLKKNDITKNSKQKSSKIIEQETLSITPGHSKDNLSDIHSTCIHSSKNNEYSIVDSYKNSHTFKSQIHFWEVIKNVKTRIMLQKINHINRYLNDFEELSDPENEFKKLKNNFEEYFAYIVINPELYFMNIYDHFKFSREINKNDINVTIKLVVETIEKSWIEFIQDNAYTQTYEQNQVLYLVAREKLLIHFKKALESALYCLQHDNGDFYQKSLNLLMQQCEEIKKWISTVFEIPSSKELDLYNLLRGIIADISLIETIHKDSFSVAGFSGSVSLNNDSTNAASVIELLSNFRETLHSIRTSIEMDRTSPTEQEQPLRLVAVPVPTDTQPLDPGLYTELLLSNPSSDRGIDLNEPQTPEQIRNNFLNALILLGSHTPAYNAITGQLYRIGQHIRHSSHTDPDPINRFSVLGMSISLPEGGNNLFHTLAESNSYNHHQSSRVQTLIYNILTALPSPDFSQLVSFLPILPPSGEVLSHDDDFHQILANSPLLAEEDSFSWGGEALFIHIANAMNRPILLILSNNEFMHDDLGLHGAIAFYTHYGRREFLTLDQLRNERASLLENPDLYIIGFLQGEDRGDWFRLWRNIDTGLSDTTSASEEEQVYVQQPIILNQSSQTNSTSTHSDSEDEACYSLCRSITSELEFYPVEAKKL